MNETIVLYHGGCRDGFCAAWVVNKWIQDQNNKHGNIIEAEFIPAYYGQEPSDCEGKDVIIVDFCYPLEAMIRIHDEANRLIWLDHHKTAIPYLNTLENAPELDRLEFKFDLNKSGAGLAWDYFFPNEPRPWLVDYVEDRDLWRKSLPNTDQVNALISALEFEFSVWDNHSDLDVNMAANIGSYIEMKTEQYVREVCKNVYFVKSKNGRLVLGEWQSIMKADIQINIPVVNICQIDCSEVLHELCKKYPESPFSLYWFKRADGLYQYGLRSIGDFDVSTVTKFFGGGGHKNAAGFQLPYLLEELK